MPVQPRHIRVFLSSPGDVPEERLLAAKVLNDLVFDPLLADKLTIQVVAWDQPGSATPMLATMTPQEAINRNMPVPGECDIVIVVFWSRMGTPLPQEYTKANGERYQSGTEWEYLNAIEAAQASAKRGETPSRPQVVVYRRSEDVAFNPRDSRFQENVAQWQRVETFFAAFRNSDGSIRQGYNPYSTPEEFRRQFEQHMKKLIAQMLNAPGFGANNEPAKSALWIGSPFPGLRAFTPDDEPIFYGRGAEIDALVERVRANRFVAVVGASGSGKSSLVGAGLLPRLAANAIEGSKDWILAKRGGDPQNRAWVGLRFTPGESDDPFLPLALRLAERLKRTPQDLAAELATHPERLPQLIDPLFDGRQTWSEALIFIDQFEELFTLSNATKIDPFVRVLQSIRESSRLRLVLTLRADFYARCVEHNRLAELLKDGTFPLSAPGTAALYEMISRPAERAGLTCDAGLIDHILTDISTDPGSLALLAYLLDELYRTRTTDNRLTVAAYQALDGVQGAIGKRAEEVVSRLSAEEQAALPRLFSELVEVDDHGRATRRRALLNPFTQDTALKHIVDVLTETRLLVTDQGEETGPVIEVAHEALLREWQRLSVWITSAQADLLLRRQLEQAAQEWETAAAEDKNAYTLVGGRLLEAQRWQAKNQVKPFVAAFILASTHQEQLRIAAENQRQRRLRLASGIAATVIGLAVLVAVIATVLVGSARHDTMQANEQAAAAGTQVQQANASLTPISSTLTSVANQVQASQDLNQALQWAASASTIVQQQTADKLLAVLLGIRALKTVYTIPADAVLVNALDTGYEKLGFVGHKAEVVSVAFSPDGHRILTGSLDKTARLWDVATGQSLQTLTGHTKAILGVAFSPDGHRILTGSADNTARLWDTDTGRSLQTLTGHINAILGVAFSPDGHRILTGSADNTARLWDADTGQLIRTLEGHAGYVYSVAFSPDSLYILTGSADNTARLWNTATGQTLRIFSGHTNVVGSATFSPDGRTILTGSWDNTARLWDAATGQLIRTLTGQRLSILSVAFSPDSRYALTGGADETAWLWDAATGQNLRILGGHTNYVTSVAFSPDSRYALTGSDDFTARLWDLSRESSPWLVGQHDDSVHSVAFSPDGRYALSGSWDNTARLWNLTNGQIVRTLVGHTDHVVSVAVSPDGRYALTGSVDKSARLWELSTGQTLQILTGHTNTVGGVAFSPDGQYALTGSDDNTARLWDVATGQSLRTFVGHQAPIRSVAFSPDGHAILTGGVDITARLWDVATGQSLRTFIGHSQVINGVVFSPDGHYVATASSDKTARLWDVATGQSLKTFTNLTGTFTSIAFSPDGRYLVTGSSDTTAQIWDVSGGQSLRVLSGHKEIVFSVAFSPDGRYILTGSADRTVRLWNVNYRDFITYACTQVWRDFSALERQRFNIPKDGPTCPQFAGIGIPTPAMLSTSTSLPVTLPVWTQIASPMPQITPTVTQQSF